MIRSYRSTKTIKVCVNCGNLEKRNPFLGKTAIFGKVSRSIDQTNMNFYLNDRRVILIIISFFTSSSQNFQRIHILNSPETYRLENGRIKNPNTFSLKIFFSK